MKTEKPHNSDSFEKIIAGKEERKLEAKRNNRSLWYGLGLFGMVGWTIAVPTFLGVALGIWLDKNYPNDFSWTLSLLVAGLMIGCVFAWNWVQKEDKEIHKKNEEIDE